MQTTPRKLTVAWPLVIFFLLPAFTRAETAVQAWVQFWHGTGNSIYEATAVAVDGSNNVIVIGYSFGVGDSDYATLKYSSAGVPLWTNRYNWPTNYADHTEAVAVDGSNNVIVTGYSYGTDIECDYATLKYSSAGVPLWTNRFNGSGNSYDYATAVAVDRSNDVIVTGYAIGNGSTNDYVTLKYSSAGMPLWTNRYNGPGNGNDMAVAVAVDGSNNVIVTGHSVGSGGYPEYATLKYSSAGVPLWTNRYNGSGYGKHAARSVALDGSNNVIVTGSSTGAGSTFYDFLTIKYSSAGTLLWTQRYNGPRDNDDIPAGLAVDASNNVIVTGDSAIGSFASDDLATLKYSSAGVPLWTNRYSGPANAYAVAVDASNSVIVTGCATRPGSFSSGDYMTIKYSSAGAPLWTNFYNGPGNAADIPYAVAVDRSGNVIVTGRTISSGSVYQFATVKYICVPSPVIANLKRSGGSFQLRVDNVLQPGTLVIEASTNLTGWGPVFTNTTPTNVVFYADPNVGNFLRKFYRAFQFP